MLRNAQARLAHKNPDRLSGDKQWLDFGDHIAQLGLRATYTRHPKQINQSARSFGKYLGYSAAALSR